MEEWARDKVTPGFGKVSILHFVNCTSGFVFVQMVWNFDQPVLNFVYLTFYIFSTAGAWDVVTA